MRLALNIGCGNDYRESDAEVTWVNVDSGNCKKDAHVDLEQKLPNLGNYDHVEAVQVLEHISKERFPELVRELYNLSNPGATWYIAVPHGFSDNYITDPTHKMPFSTRTFDYFVDGTPLRENGIIYGWGDIRLQYISPPQMDGNQSIHFYLKVVKKND